MTGLTTRELCSENLSWPFRASMGRVLNGQFHSNISSKVLGQEFQWSQVCLEGNPKILCASFLIWSPLACAFSLQIGQKGWEWKQCNYKKTFIYQPKPLPHPLHAALCSSTFPPFFWAHLPDLSTQTKHAKHCTSHCCLWKSLWKHTRIQAKD